MYFSLNLRPPRELSLGFGTIKASSWRCSGLLPGVSPVFDRTETILEEIFSRSPGSQSCIWERFPPESSLSGSVPSRHLLGAVAVYYRGSPQYSIVQKLFWEKSFPHSPGSQSCLWERSPSESTLSGSLPSRHLLGAVAIYYRGSPQYSIVQKTILEEIFSPLARLPELSLGALPRRELALRFGTIKASSWRCSGLLPGISRVFDRTGTVLGEIFSPLARLPELYLGALPPRELALGFGAIKASSWRCSGLLPGVFSVFDRTETILEEIFSPLARLPELYLEAISPREHALEFGTIKASSWHCSGLLPGVSLVLDRTETILGEIFFPLARLPELYLGALPPREHALGFGTIKASSWRCSGLLPGVSPVLDRTETILEEIVSPLARLPELSLGALPPRELALGFGTIKASSWRCSGLLPGVSPVFDRTETILGEIVSPLARLPELSLEALPPREHALGFGTIKASSWRGTNLPPEVSSVFDRTERVG